MKIKDLHRWYRISIIQVFACSKELSRTYLKGILEEINACRSNINSSESSFMNIKMYYLVAGQMDYMLQYRVKFKRILYRNRNGWNN